uniref:Uncharacterized protein AlNc14C57G4297 n=1 Tax=Albugo laibachii Nc14 TaxID=890382 RepID=F0WCB3_9STRA|nr:conserved hypothetical protein [Albugo laibachii Nc14]|eukprot:CCA18828.1 conserved hypothetical protein [Albugo laibachii Nc14]
METVIRVLVIHPIHAGSILLVCLRRPLKWNDVINEIYQVITDADELPHPDQYQNCKLLLHPTKSKTEKGVVIRKKHLDRSIRDGDLLSIIGLCVNPNIKFGSHANFQDPLDSTEKNEAQYPPEWTKESHTIENASESIAYIPPADELLHASLQKKRNRSISSKFWLINKLAATGVISPEQKDSLKLLLLTSDNSSLLSAFETYEATGDVTTLLSLDTRMKRTHSDLSANSTSQFQSISKDLEDELELLSRTVDCDRIHRQVENPNFDLNDDELDALVQDIMAMKSQQE